MKMVVSRPFKVFIEGKNGGSYKCLLIRCDNP